MLFNHEVMLPKSNMFTLEMFSVDMLLLYFIRVCFCIAWHWHSFACFEYQITVCNLLNMIIIQCISKLCVCLCPQRWHIVIDSSVHPFFVRRITLNYARHQHETL